MFSIFKVEFIDIVSSFVEDFADVDTDRIYLPVLEFFESDAVEEGNEDRGWLLSKCDQRVHGNHILTIWRCYILS